MVSTSGLRRSRVARAVGAGLAAGALALAVPGSGAAAVVAADPPQTSPLEQVQALVQPAVVYEQITWTGFVYDRTNEQYFTEEPFTVSFQCTGFVVNPDGYVGTAGHCVDYDRTVEEAILSQVVDWAFDNDYYAATPSKATIASFTSHWRIDGENGQGQPDLDVSVAYGVSVSGEPSGKALPARVVAVRAQGEGDVSLLKIDAKDLTVIPLSDNENTGVGTEVVAVGYPASVDLVTDANFNPSFKEGAISAEKTTQGGLLPVYEISAAVSGGMSGGPTVALDGDVIGVNSFRITGETQAFNFVQPSQTLSEVLRGEGVENTMGQVTDLYRAGLASYFAGDGAAATESFEKVLQIVPSHQFAQEYLRKSQALPSSSMGWLIPVLIAAAVLAAIVIVGLVLLSRRRKPAVAGAAPAGGVAATGQAVFAEPVSQQWAPPGAAPGTPPGAAPGATAPPAAGPLPEPPPHDTASIPPPPPPPVAPPAADVAPAAAEPAPEPVSEPDADAGTAEEEGAGLFCPNCGKRHEPDDHFCPHCGHVLK